MTNNQSLADICHTQPVVVFDVVNAPWTDAQVLLINAWQENPETHELSCMTHSHQALVATNESLTCEACDFIQTWVPGVVLN